MRPPTAHALLAVWEMGRDRHPIDRGVLLHALAEPDAEPDGLAAEPLGRRNAALLRLRLATFGDTMRAYLDCPGCRAQLELELDGTTLLASQPDVMEAVVVGELTFRPPTSKDLATILKETSSEQAALRLLRLCAVGVDESITEAELAPLLDSVESALEEADPLADITLEFRCRSCQYDWTAPFDIGGFLWEEIDAYAARLLEEIHILASAYGWSEASILSLSDSRRAAYIQRVTA